MPCPICGRIMCDCSPADRGQPQDTMMDEYEKDHQSAKKSQRQTGSKEGSQDKSSESD